MGKGGRSRARRRPNDVRCSPTPERRAHGLIERVVYPIEDSLGGKGRPLRALDTLIRMERASSISEAEVRAGRTFHELFRRAAFDQLFAADPSRPPVGSTNGGGYEEVEGSDAARLAIASALEAVGGPASPGGSCAWCVLGLDMSLTAWVTSRTLTRPLDRYQASGILIHDLDVLKRHFRY